MFGLFKKHPEKKLKQAYEQTLEQAMHAQRNGDIRRYSELSRDAEQIYGQLQALQQRAGGKG